MPPVVAAAAITAGAAITGAKMQSGASRRAVDAQTQAANRAAEIQAQAQAEALAFQRQVAQNAYQNDEVTRRANYEQWAATEGRRGTIGEMLGLGKRNIPAYVPGVDPRFDGSGGTSGPMPVPGSGRPPIAATPQGSVGSYLRGELDPTRRLVNPNPAPLDPELEAMAERKRAAHGRGTPGSVGSYLRSA